MNKIIVLLIASLALVGCKDAPVVSGEADQLGLYEMSGSRMDALHLNMDHDFGQYDSVMITDIILTDVAIKQPSKSSVHRGEWEMTDQREERIQREYRASFEREFGKNGGLELVTEPTGSTLVVAGRLRSVAPTVAVDASEYAGRARTYSDTSGSAQLEIVLLDGKSGEVVAVAIDSRSVGSTWNVNNSVTNSSNARKVFNSWAKMASKAVAELPGFVSPVTS